MCTWMVYSIQRLGPFSSRGTEQVSTMDPKAQPQGLRQDENGGHATIAPASCASCGWFRWTMLDLSQETWCLKIGRCVEKSYEVWGSKCLGNCFQHLHVSFQHFSTKSRLAPLQLMWKSADLRLPEISPLSKSEENPKNPNENHGARHGEGTCRSNQPQGPRHGQRPVALCSRPKMPATRALRGPPGPKGRLNSGMVDLRNKRHRGTTGMIHQNPSN